MTGAAGFIGSAFLRLAVDRGYRIAVLDALTYAGHYKNIEDLVESGKVSFVRGSIADAALVQDILQKERFDAVLNFAAESHVDNSIAGPKDFIETNINGTFVLLEASRDYWRRLPADQKGKFRFLQVSTDEVFGSLGETGKFNERTPYQPNSPYSASKAAADHLVRAWHHTYGLPTIITNCSNNYGPRQFPEKLIPRMIVCALHQEPLPVYGAGRNVRDWIHVEDHSTGVLLALEKGRPGEAYCFGGNSERANIDVVKAICSALDEYAPRPDGRSHDVGIEFVTDRLGHDFRYAIDDSLAQAELGFRRRYEKFEDGLRQTVQWYLENPEWLQSVLQKKK